MKYEPDTIEALLRRTQITTLIPALIGALVTAVATVAVIKTDLQYLKEAVAHNVELTQSLGDRLTNHIIEHAKGKTNG